MSHGPRKPAQATPACQPPLTQRHRALPWRENWTPTLIGMPRGAIPHSRTTKHSGDSSQQDLSSWKSGGCLSPSDRLECHPSRVTLTLPLAGPSPLPGWTIKASCCVLLRATWRERADKGMAGDFRGIFAHMPLALGSRGRHSLQGNFWKIFPRRFQ